MRTLHREINSSTPVLSPRFFKACCRSSPAMVSRFTMINSWEMMGLLFCKSSDTRLMAASKPWPASTQTTSRSRASGIDSLIFFWRELIRRFRIISGRINPKEQRAMGIPINRPRWSVFPHRMYKKPPANQFARRGLMGLCPSVDNEPVPPRLSAASAPGPRGRVPQIIPSTFQGHGGGFWRGIS